MIMIHSQLVMTLVVKVRRQRMIMVFIYFLVCLFMTYGDAYKILVVYPMPSTSHSILGDGIVNILAKTGHEVTYITPFPKGNYASNVREIDVSDNKNFLPDGIKNLKAILNKEESAHNSSITSTLLPQVNAHTIENKLVQKLINDPKEQFDVVIVEWMFSELLAGLSAVFNCPFIWVSSTDPHWRIIRLVDDIPNPAYTPDAISDNEVPMTFLQRVQELIVPVKGLLMQKFINPSKQSDYYEKLLVPVIRKRGNYVPTFDNLIYNASLVLSNSHVSIGKVIRLPQNYIQIGGYHISRDVKPLPENLKNLLDNAKNGLIYFSMGTNLKSKLMPDELKQSLLQMFSKLKYTILWKFEDDLPNAPPNVHIVQWAPQQSILAHPNCVLFITHGGLLSITEAIHFGKPIIAIPVFADQFNNAKRAVEKGFAKKVDLSYAMADDINIAIEDILKDQKYVTKAKELSMIYHDRLVTPDKELVHWVEHVVKTRGARHLRSPALDLAWYQKLYLDLVALLIVVITIILNLLKRFITLFKKNHKDLGKKKRR